MKKLKVAVFGTGYWSHFQIAAWQSVGAQVVAAWNRTYEKAEQTASRFDIPRVCLTPEEVFDTCEFDVADIITGPESHEELVLLSASHGKAVICQKPMSLTLSSCERMVKACADAGVWYAVHENFRFQPPIRQFKAVLESGEIGRVYRAHIQLKSPDRPIIEKQPALARTDHMALRDMGPHCFDVGRCLFGEAERIYTRPLVGYPDIGVDDTALSLIEMENGMLVSCDLVHSFPYKIFAEGENGTIMLDSDNVIHIVKDGVRTVIDTRTWNKLSYIPDEDWVVHGGHVFAAIPACLEMLRNALLEGVQAETSGEDNLMTMRLVFAAIKSSDEGNAVRL